MAPRVTGAEREAAKLMVTTAVPELPTVSEPALVTSVEGLASSGLTTVAVTEAVLVA